MKKLFALLLFILFANSALNADLATYFLPKDHPAKAVLDEIFAKSNPLTSPEAMLKAGFEGRKLHEDIKNDLIVVNHPQIKGFVVKLYLDRDDEIDEAKFWLRRMEGLERVKQSVEKHSYQSLMRYPHKWVYQVPNPSPNGKKYILIADDQEVVSNEENELLYKTKMTPELLEAIFTVLTENKLYDLIYIDNIPFSKDGRIAFVDTEDFDRKPVVLKDMTQYFSVPMQIVWSSMLRFHNCAE